MNKTMRIVVIIVVIMLVIACGVFLFSNRSASSVSTTTYTNNITDTASAANSAYKNGTTSTTVEESLKNAPIPTSINEGGPTSADSEADTYLVVHKSTPAPSPSDFNDSYLDLQ